jgi:hypothetical protein
MCRNCKIFSLVLVFAQTLVQARLLHHLIKALSTPLGFQVYIATDIEYCTPILATNYLGHRASLHWPQIRRLPGPKHAISQTTASGGTDKVPGKVTSSRGPLDDVQVSTDIAQPVHESVLL